MSQVDTPAVSAARARARGRLDASGELVHGRHGRCARARAALRPRLDVRRPRRVGRASRARTSQRRSATCPSAVVRGSDGVLRGLVNVCRHRGHLVVEGTGCRETLQCPYHAWTYDLDGSLRRAPRAEREPGFDPTGLSLARVSVDTWGPFVFVNPDPDAAPLTGRARPPARDRRREWPRRRRDPLPLASRVADRGELEGRDGELPRVLPLPDRAPGLQQGHRRQPRLVPRSRCIRRSRARSAPFGHRALRATATLRTHRAATCRSRSTTSCSRRRRSTSHRASRTSRSSDTCPTASRRTIEVTDYYFGVDASDGGDRGAHGVGQPGRRGGRLARAVGSARPRVRRGAAGTSDGDERAAHRGLPAACVRGADVAGMKQ